MDKKVRGKKRLKEELREKRAGIVTSVKNTVSDLYFSLKKEKLPQLLLVIVFFVVVVSVLLALIESGQGRMMEGDAGFFKKLGTAVYYGFTTITTVGYGDYSPKTPLGRMMAVVIMLFGIVTISMLTATVASIFVERKIMEGRGLIKLSNIKDHIVLCGWKKGMAKLLNEILQINEGAKPGDFVIVAGVAPDEIEVFRQQNPALRDVRFLRGEHFNENILRQASVREARAAYILADESSEASISETDSKTVMAAMAIRTMAKNLHICAELLDVKFKGYLENAHVSEIIFPNEYGRFLIANSTVSTGITKVINELIDVNSGTFMHTREMPAEFVGKQYSDLKEHYSKQKDIMLLGLVENTGSYFEMKNEALREAQKTADISQIVKNLNEVKKMKSNQPVINPPGEHKLSTHTLVILIQNRGNGKASE